MVIPTNSDGYIPCQSHCISCLCRQTNWLAHLVPPKIRLCHHIQIDVHLSAAVPKIWYLRWTQHRWWPTFYLQYIPRITSDVVCEAQTILSYIPLMQWPGRTCSKNCKEDSEQKHRPPRLLGQWQCCPAHPTVLKNPNPRYWPITGTTPTSPLTPWFHPLTTNPLQAPPWMGSGGTVPRRTPPPPQCQNSRKVQ